jgi:hypothetical protein
MLSGDAGSSEAEEDDDAVAAVSRPSEMAQLCTSTSSVDYAVEMWV